MSLRLCHPGKFGDLLWALPTARALAEQAGEGVKLYLPEALRPIALLLEKQGDYIVDVQLMPEWIVQDSAPATPLQPPGVPIPSLGYMSWPAYALPYQVAAQQSIAMLQTADTDAFFRPWIDVLPMGLGLASGVPRVAVHWTDRWFELKLGIVKELKRVLGFDFAIDWYAPHGSRMQEAGATGVDWLALARTLTAYRVVLTDCSAAHVLAAAVGVPTILVVEPEPDRHHFIFWPGSDEQWQPRDTVLGRMIRPVLGNGHKPTFDSRHTIDAVRTALHGKDR